MRLSLLESSFWFGNALRALGLPYGASAAAIKLLQWAETVHGTGWTQLKARRGHPLACDPSAARMTAESDQDFTLDAAGQSCLLLGPGLLDLATAKAREGGRALARVTGLADLALTEALAERAAERGLVCLLAYRADQQGYGLVALPSEDGPLLVELAAAPLSHSGFWSEGLAALVRDDLAERSLSADSAAPAGLTLACMMPSVLDLPGFEAAIRAAAAGSLQTRLYEPAELARLRKAVVERGFEVPDQDWQSLARFALTAVVPSSEESRIQAGADT